MFRFLFPTLAIVMWFSPPIAAQPVAVEITESWAGKFGDEALRMSAPESGFVGDPVAWEKLWKAWRPGEDIPEVDFRRELILVGTVPGPNLVLLRPTIADGDIKMLVGGTLIGGPGFGYKIVKVPREGVGSVNGTAIAATSKEKIVVEVVGKLNHGVMAIGGETTGTTITAKGITWELDLQANQRLAETAEKNEGQLVRVMGTLERRVGVELKQRWIVTVTSLAAFDESDDGQASAGVEGEATRPETKIKTVRNGSIVAADITCPSGIDRMILRRTGETWPQRMVLRLRIRGLESLTVKVADRSVNWSIPSSSPNTRLMSMIVGERRQKLDESSAYYSKVRIVDGGETIPLKSGYFEVELPRELFKSNPDQVNVAWVDFYRF